MSELSYAEVAPASGLEPKYAVIFLHGYGANGADLIGLSENFAEALPDAVFISPDAPEVCEMSPFGYQWFSLSSWEEEHLINGIKDAAPTLDDFITTIAKKYNLEDSKIFLVGFSQGTMMSLHVAMRRSKHIAGVIGFSGALVDGDALSHELTARPPVLLVHGMMDMVVPYISMSDAESVLKRNGISVSTLSRPALGHGIDYEGIEAGKVFMKKLASG